MYQSQVYYLINVLMLLDGLIVILAGYLAFYVRRVWIGGYLWNIDGALFIGMVLCLMFVNNFIMARLGLYSDRRVESFWKMVQRIVLAVVLNFAFLNITIIALHLEPPSRLFMLLFASFMLLGFVVERFVMEIYLERRQPSNYNSRQILLVGSGSRAGLVAEALKQQKSWGHQVIGFVRPFKDGENRVDHLPQLGEMEDLKQILIDHSVDEVVFAISPRDSAQVDLKPSLDMCDTMGVTCRIVPAMFDPASGKSLKVESIQNIPTLSRETIHINATGLLYKRVLDFAVGLAGFVLLVLIYPFAALAIKLDSPGPVFFRQPRVGQHGRMFKLYKFRTMHLDAEKRKRDLIAQHGGDARFFKLENDPRITRVGQFLRKYSLDEFPQFVNVLKGEMSLVGTRPPTPEEVEKYDLKHRRRIAIKPGITGLWQISGRSQVTDFEVVVKLDLEYIDGWHFMNDLKILWRTVWVVLRRKGAF